MIDLPAKGGMVELVLKRESLSQQLRGFAVQMFWALLFISGLTGALAYLALYFWVVRPIQRLTSALTVFSERPDDPTGQLVASERDEIGLGRQTRATQEAVRDTGTAGTPRRAGCCGGANQSRYEKQPGHRDPARIA